MNGRSSSIKLCHTHKYVIIYVKYHFFLLWMNEKYLKAIAYLFCHNFVVVSLIQNFYYFSWEYLVPLKTYFNFTFFCILN